MHEAIIRPVTLGDAVAIALIYNPYIADTTISFEERPVDEHIMINRMRDVEAQGLPWLVLEQDGEILGYAYASRWKIRSAYRHSVETSIYFARHARGQGLGATLYQALLATLQGLDIHLAIAGIALPNPASIGLHERLGFRAVGIFKEVGFKFEQWVDVGYWQKALVVA